MVSKQTTIINATGLHARPASVFVSEAKKFESNVTIKNVDKDSAPVNAKSIMMILAAGLGTGTKIALTSRQLLTLLSLSLTAVLASKLTAYIMCMLSPAFCRAFFKERLV